VVGKINVNASTMEAVALATVAQELESFVEFVKARLCGGEPKPPLDELFDLWRIENPTDADYAENIAAISGAIDDYRKGDRGRAARELSRELRDELGIREK
jgi:hypothetical protein